LKDVGIEPDQVGKALPVCFSAVDIVTAYSIKVAASQWKLWSDARVQGIAN